ncbi:MAG: hypothetical protein FWF05_01650 [Oscillospiraceae bacterium]|nr:hypothetical protein [Oscillospiraceae bacterium]
MALKLKRKPKVIKTYRQSVPAMRFVGKMYGDHDRGPNGMFDIRWGEWHSNGWFKLLEEACPKADFENADACVGLMRWKGDGDDKEPFQYWIGMFFPENTSVPDGYGFVDFPASDLGVGWLYGKESYIYCKEHLAAKSCEKQGMKIIADDQGACWFFERYACPRFAAPDKRGKVILDICHYVEKE